MDIDSYDSPAAEALLVRRDERITFRPRGRRELITNVAAAASFLIAASLFAVLAPWHRPFSVVSLLLVLVVWLIVEHVRFPVGSFSTAPTMLVFVPALFVLPTPLVPLIAAAVLVLIHAPDLIRRRAPIAMAPVPIADAWFALGPSVVIVVTGTQVFAWSHWPAYLLALAAQFVTDMVATSAWAWIGEGITPRDQAPLLIWLYLLDLVLAPLGLVIAAVSVNRPGLILLALSPLAMLWLFARERQQRMDETLALSTAYRGTTLLLGDVVEADDHYTGAHSRDVVRLGLAVADRLGLDDTEKRNVEFTAMLHDVGKIRVPKEILNKPGPLDESEWVVMHGHTIAGEQMLGQVGGLLVSVGRMVRATHERYDGAGYPDGLAGETIPIEARIVASCDAFSAMTTDRPYRSSMSMVEALAELRSCAGSQFDPRVVGAIEQLMGGPRLRRRPAAKPAALSPV